MGRPPKPLRDRFIRRFVVGDPHECWEADGAPLKGGYKQIKGEDGTLLQVHRVAFAYANGMDPANMGDFLVCHSCDNPPCCNPNHLFAGTVKDNVEDMHAKNRANTPKGDRHHASRLTTEQVRYVRKEYAEGHRTQQEIADELGVSQSTVHCTIIHKVYAHVGDENDEDDTKDA